MYKEIYNVKLHEEYRRIKMADGRQIAINDIALVTVKLSFVWNTQEMPACLPYSADFKNYESRLIVSKNFGSPSSS